MRSLSLLPLLLLAPLSASQAAPTPVTGVAFTHNDWTLACDNTRTCRAAGYQADDDGDALPVSVLLTRHGGPDLAVTAELMLGQYDETVLPARLSLRIDGADQGALADAAEAGTAALRAPQVAALLASLPGNSRIVLTSDDKRHWTLSGSGASAVLLKMDEFQGRLGTPGALMRKGKRAEASVLPALPVPVVVPGKMVATRPADEALAGSAALRAALAASTSVDDCESVGPSEGLMAAEGPQDITVKRLSAGKLLVSMICWRGAYNEGSGYWVVNDRAPYQPELVTNLGNEDDVHTISASHKGRGLGDCWSMHSWSWDGTRFVPTAASTSGMCRLVAAGGAWDLPTLVTKVQD